jgi:hypothetical protein
MEGRDEGHCKRATHRNREGKLLAKGSPPATIPTEGWPHLVGFKFFVVLVRVHERTLELPLFVEEAFSDNPAAPLQ